MGAWDEAAAEAEANGEASGEDPTQRRRSSSSTTQDWELVGTNAQRSTASPDKSTDKAAVGQFTGARQGQGQGRGSASSASAGGGALQAWDSEGYLSEPVEWLTSAWLDDGGTGPKYNQQLDSGASARCRTPLAREGCGALLAAMHGAECGALQRQQAALARRWQQVVEASPA